MFLKERTRTKSDELKHFVLTTGVKIDVYPAPEETVEFDVPVDTRSEVPATVSAVVEEPADRTRNALAAMAYMNILFLVPLLAPNRDEFVSAHLKQGVALFAVSVALSFTAWVSARAWLGIAALLVVGSAFLAARAWQGRTARLPLIGGIAEKLAV